ncbi:MAG: PaaI family thioesterase [Deltaproteobacteria bacterium]|nr:PaaI family thioesterase [Deltaproteobacteria bacterium]
MSNSSDSSDASDTHPGTPGDETRARLERAHRAFSHTVPHNNALGIEILDLRDGEADMRMPWAPHLVGNPDTGVLHGGVITALLDACCGAAVFQALREPKPIATLDLRIDYMKPPRPRAEVHARATVTKVTRNVAFVRAAAHHGDPEDPVATASASFMLGTPSGPPPEQP